MKKIFTPVLALLFVALGLGTTSCNDKVCIKCTKIQQPEVVAEMCSSDQNERNDFIVNWTHQDFNCVNE